MCLFCRVIHYTKNNLDKKYLRDPDGGVNVLKKKAEAGLLSETQPKELDRFPSDGYGTDMSKVPKITFGTIWQFMIDSMEWRKQISTAKPLVKGYNFFMSNHVLSTYHLMKDSKHFIKSQVLPSMKKNMVYTCFIKLSSLGYVLAAKCGCPAGIDGRCNHVCATLFLFDSIHKKKIKNVQAQNSDESSCTSEPCKWNIPSKRKGNVMPITAMKFRKHDYSKVKVDKLNLSTESNEDFGFRNGKEWNKDRLQGMLEKLKKIQNETGQFHLP